jgi:DHA2 family multidrug resistance protein-like MFS transporter
MTPASTDAMNTAPVQFRGEASGVMQTVRQVAGTIGLAVMGTIVASVQADKLNAAAASAGATAAQRAEFSHRLAEAHGNPAGLRGVPAQVIDTTKHALASGISTAYYVGAAVMLVGAVVALALLRHVKAADEEAPVKPPPTPGAHPALGVAAAE